MQQAASAGKRVRANHQDCGCRFVPYQLKKWRERFVNQSQRKESNYEITFYSQLKTALSKVVTGFETNKARTRAEVVRTL